MAKKGATEQQKRFIDEFIRMRENNQTQAAINAGYSTKSAASQSSQLLKNPKVIEYLQEKKSEMEQMLRQEFMYDALEARKVMYEIMNDFEAPENVRLSAAKDFLDRAGFKPVEKQETTLHGEIDIGATADIVDKYLRSD